MQLLSIADNVRPNKLVHLKQLSRLKPADQAEQLYLSYVSVEATGAMCKLLARTLL